MLFACRDLLFAFADSFSCLMCIVKVAALFFPMALELFFSYCCHSIWGFKLFILFF